jgi:hypothetical protein
MCSLSRGFDLPYRNEVWYSDFNFLEQFSIHKPKEDFKRNSEVIINT